MAEAPIQFTHENLLSCLKKSPSLPKKEEECVAMAQYIETVLWDKIKALDATDGFNSSLEAFASPIFFHNVRYFHGSSFDPAAWKVLKICEDIQESNHYRKFFLPKKKKSRTQKPQTQEESFTYPDPREESQGLIAMEGASSTLGETERKKRNHALRLSCIKVHGTTCAVCGFDFAKVYGELGKDFIHIHHLNPISQTSGEHKVNAATDLIPLCANCHAMVHRKSPPLAPEELRKILEGRR